MDEQRLAEIEARHADHCHISCEAGFGQWMGECPGPEWCSEVALIAEVRRLQAEET